MFEIFNLPDFISIKINTRKLDKAFRTIIKNKDQQKHHAKEV